MILPIVAYGSPILRKKAVEIDKNYPDLKKLIEDMFQTMEASQGVGLAAPQINKSIRLLVIDADGYKEDEPTLEGFIKVMINPTIIEFSGEKILFNEGCLSVPGIREDIERYDIIKIKYQDQDFNTFEETYSGIASRIIQHEYDHLEGVVFTDRCSVLKKRLLKSKLIEISKGITNANYRMNFPNKK